MSIGRVSVGLLRVWITQQVGWNPELCGRKTKLLIQHMRQVRVMRMSEWRNPGSDSRADACQSGEWGVYIWVHHLRNHRIDPSECSAQRLLRGAEAERLKWIRVIRS